MSKEDFGKGVVSPHGPGNGDFRKMLYGVAAVLVLTAVYVLFFRGHR